MQKNFFVTILLPEHPKLITKKHIERVIHNSNNQTQGVSQHYIIYLTPLLKFVISPNNGYAQSVSYLENVLKNNTSKNKQNM